MALAIIGCFISNKPKSENNKETRRLSYSYSENNVVESQPQTKSGQAKNNFVQTFRRQKVTLGCAIFERNSRNFGAHSPNRKVLLCLHCQ